jgi:hypothetical protein
MGKYHLLLWLFLLGFSSTGYGQTINFEDGFEDGDFTDNPTWTGDDTLYTVIPESPNNLLQLQGDGENGGTDYLSTASTNSVGSWEFYIQLGFSPSDGNRADIFLMSDITNLEGPVNGYALRAGESGSNDVFRIVRYDGGSQATTVLSGTTDISEGGSFRVKVRRQSGGLWTLEVAEGYSGILAQEGGTQTDATYNFTNYFGLRSTYTSSRSDLFYFDFKIDLPPLTITDAAAQGDSISVTFNRPFDASTIQATDFSISQGIGTPSAINISSTNRVKLVYDEPLSSNRYEVSAQSIQDLQGNTIKANATAPFIALGTAHEDDLILNEFMYDPPTELPEYVELRNTSGKYLNLQHWHIGDDSNSRELSADTLTIAPNDFLVISSDTTTLSSIFGHHHYVQANIPSLNNSGDILKLLTHSGIPADSLSYTTDWGGDQVALERRVAVVSETYRENWGNSPASSGGTPGSTNQVAPDTQPPDLRSMNILSDLTLQLLFDERLDSSATDLSHFSLDNITVNTATFSHPDTVELTLNNPLQNAQSYQLTISGPEDIFGNTAASSDTSFTYYKVTAADSGDIFINEFMYAPPSSQSEYVELYNRSSKTLDLQNWTINDATGSEAVISHQQFLLPPDSLVVLAPDSILRSDHPGVPLIEMGNRFPSLNNSGDNIVLHNSAGSRLDSLQYKSHWGGLEIALERRSQAVSAIYASNWGNAPTEFGSPGQQNQIEEDQTPPAIEELAIISNDSLRLTISEHPDVSSAEIVSNYSITDNLAISSAHFQQPDTIGIGLSALLQNNMTYTFTIDGLQDLFGNTATNIDTSFTHYEVSSADSGHVFISEFLFDPSEGESEYIEIYNSTQQSFDLQQWSINDNTGTIRTITDERYILPPDGYVILAGDRSLASQYNNLSLISLGSQFPSLNNSGDDIVLRDSSGILLDSLRYSSGWATSRKAAERRSLDLSSALKTNWGSPADTTGSPGQPNVIAPDTQPPVLTAFNIIDDQQLQLIFDEQLADITQYGNFGISASTQISDQTLFAPDTVRLQLSEPLENATEYRISVSEVQDMFDNKLTATDTLFTYYQPSQADSGQVFINEFSYNPAAGKAEYIELYNPTEHSFNLRGWTLSDNRGEENEIISESHILPPESYVVLSPDNSFLETAPDLALIAMGSRFPALNNSGDDIVIRNAQGLRLDSLQYTSAWGGEETALERRTVTISGTFAENWGFVSDQTGTPGSENAITPDQQSPNLSAVEIINPSELQLVFSERLTANSAIKKTNYHLSPSSNIRLISARADTVTLYLSDPLTSDQEYTLSVADVQDIFGNKSSENKRELNYIEIAEAATGDIIVNEIMNNPGPNSAEFVELYNRSDKNIDLSNWTFSDASNAVDIPSDVILKKGTYLTLTGSPSFAQTVEPTLMLSGFPNLNNSEETLSLYNAKGQLIDSLRYNEEWPEIAQSISLERKDPKAASNDPSNWAVHATDQKSSAGTENSRFEKDSNPPGVQFSKIRDDGKIEIYFTEFIQNTQQLQFTIQGQPLEKHSFDSHSGNRIVLEQAESLAPAIEIQNLTDIRGNTTNNTEIPLARPVQKGDLVINEIMYNPLNDGSDNQADQSEYVELYNLRDYALSLEGLVLHDAPDEDDDVQELRPVSTTGKWVQPKQTVLVYADEGTAFAKSKIATFFELDSLNTASTLQIDRSSLSLGSNDDAIFIADSSGGVIDSVYYSEEWQNPNLIDYRGRALERISPTGASNTANNWGSSVHSKGGTPHAQNSLFQEQPEQPQQVGISFAPNPFSPDGDGYEDNLVISYKLDQADYLLRINIFDRYGRHIKELADGKPAGFEGTIIWDGRRDDGSRNRIGIYIIVFEAINSSSGGDKAFKKTVVIARKLN